MRFLLIEDNAGLAESVQARLAMDGHAVDWADTLDAAEACMDGADYDLILVDIMLPDGDGRTFIARHRARQAETPVIVLTARSAVSDRVQVLDLGADDYLTKPFDVAELVARCRAVLRRRGGTASNVIRLGNLEFDPLAATVRVDGEPRELRNRELRMLEIFISARGRLLSKGQLHDRMFSFAEDVSDNAIEVYVGRLRRKLQGATVRIETVRGVGYRMAGP
ncbi:response regulator transcription factor [Oceanomicrobium pacificus]|uniref:Response regulator n=1 Tax=Oceanomicrobium pacificus TaxID=2692916 RepID=A0A6B0TZD9_9RHOB|nr:response regulator transcription factor [Oceanomicrobium pacificus]MXU66632.1 response regulator [Oceanomicrobium pacificus]